MESNENIKKKKNVEPVLSQNPVPVYRQTGSQTGTL